MLSIRHAIACAVVLILFFSASGTSVWAQAPGSSSAGRAGSLAVQQDPFAEPDTIPRFALGPVVELKFRGGIGEFADGRSIGLSNGPTFGARAELRLNRTVTFVVRGSYARTEEKVVFSTGDAFFAGQTTHIEAAGELLLKGKASVPGYFIFGGGVRFVNPDAEVDATTARFTTAESTTESLIIGGVGLELGGRRRGVFRIEGRFTFSFPTEQVEFETKSVATDFALGLAYLFRF